MNKKGMHTHFLKHYLHFLKHYRFRQYKMPFTSNRYNKKERL